MAKYYSRTPQEFQKYLSSLRTDSKKRNWKNLIYFVDLALLMFVFFMISKLLNPALDVNLKTSTKERVNNLEIYFAKSNQTDKDIATYFLFFKNLSSNSINLSELTAEFTILNELGNLCYKKELMFSQKSIAPNVIEHTQFSIPKISKENLSEECKSLYKKPPFPKTLDTILDFSKKYRFDSYLKLKGEINRELIMTDDYWR